MFYEDRTVEQASGLGINLLLSGLGGDEFISTGDRGVEQDLLAGLKLETFFRRNPVRPFRKFIKNQLLYVIYPALGVLDKGTAKSFRDDARYLRKPFGNSDRGAIRNFFFHVSRRQMHLRMLQFYHLQRRCENWMVTGYHHGMEYRYPLLDRRIIEYMLKVPSELLCITNQFRPLLRELGKDILTEEIRMNISKTDPVSWSYTRDLFRTAALSYMGSLANGGSILISSFLDFGLLARDIEQYNESGDLADDMTFFKALVTIKAVHEFTKRYRREIKAPAAEQRICVGCGFCCDGTLFVNAGLNPGERGGLPEKIEQASFSEGGKDYFRLPCNYFSGKCTIYDRKRADVCSSYRCQLLKDFAAGKVAMDEALSTVRDAFELRNEIIEGFRRISGKEGAVYFRKILNDLGRIMRSGKERWSDPGYEMLIAGVIFLRHC